MPGNELQTFNSADNVMTQISIILNLFSFANNLQILQNMLLNIQVTMIFLSDQQNAFVQASDQSNRELKLEGKIQYISIGDLQVLCREESHV